MIKTLFAMVLLALAAPVMADDFGRTITVNGAGSASAKPDKAIVQMSIVAREPSLAAAQKAAGDVSARVLKMTDDLGINRNRVDTTGSSIRPDYRWDRETEEQRLRGYIAERQMRIEVRNLDKLGEIIEGAVKSGVNQVTPPQLDSSKRRDAYRDALQKAAEDARKNAERLASALGAKLGKVQQINTGSQARPPMPTMRMATADAMESGAAETYNAGALSFNATVTVVFELAD